MAPSGLKNFFLKAHSNCLSFKPAYLISISSGRGGAYPIAELRMSSYKNNQIMYLPEHLIIRNVEKMFLDNQDKENKDEENKEDIYIRKRLKYGLNVLIKTAELLKPLPNSEVIDLETYPYGM